MEASRLAQTTPGQVLFAAGKTSSLELTLNMVRALWRESFFRKLQSANQQCLQSQFLKPDVLLILPRVLVLGCAGAHTRLQVQHLEEE